MDGMAAPFSGGPFKEPRTDAALGVPGPSVRPRKRAYERHLWVVFVAEDARLKLSQRLACAHE